MVVVSYMMRDRVQVHQQNTLPTWNPTVLRLHHGVNVCEGCVCVRVRTRARMHACAHACTGPMVVDTI